MTIQMPIVAKRAVSLSTVPAGTMPPLAPIAMPKQVLARNKGGLRARVRALVGRLVMMTHNFRRIG